MKPKCGAPLRNITGTCDRPVTVVREGKGYCWTHDPVRISEERKAAWDARKLEMRLTEIKHERRVKTRLLRNAAGVDKLTDDDLEAIVALGGVHAMIEKLSPARD